MGAEEREYRHQQDIGVGRAAAVVPAGATNVKRVGNALVSYVARPAHPVRRRLTAWQMNAIQRRRELNLIVLYRRVEGYAIGPDLGWAMVIANLLRVLHDAVTEETLKIEAAAIGLPPLDEGVIALAVHDIMEKVWTSKYRLYTPRQAGSAILLTSVEREEAGVTKMEAVEESGAVRRRRENRERMRRKRAARAALREPTQKEIADGLGIGLRTLQRKLKAGEIIIGAEVLSPIDPCTEKPPHGPAHRKCATVQGGGT